MNRQLMITGAAFGGAAVIVGAFGAHGLQQLLTENRLRIFHTGVEYQFYHSFALLITGIAAERFSSKTLRWAGIFFILGIILFSGSLFCLSIIPALSWIGSVTPIGGLCFIGGWACLIIAIMKKDIVI